MSDGRKTYDLLRREDTKLNFLDFTDGSRRIGELMAKHVENRQNRKKALEFAVATQMVYKFPNAELSTARDAE